MLYFKIKIPDMILSEIQTLSTLPLWSSFVSLTIINFKQIYRKILHVYTNTAIIQIQIKTDLFKYNY